MTMFRKLGLVSVGSLVLACSAEAGSGNDVPMGESDDSIIRSTAETGKDQVVMVYGVGNFGSTEICSGTYTSSRVVITAAHCLQNMYQVFVYFGDAAPADFSELRHLAKGFATPAADSHWAQADSWESHPDYDANLNHPDLGAVYLDRKLPFKPLPIARFPLNKSYAGKKMTVMGWGSGATDGPVVGVDYAIQRTGIQKFIGTPTAADYHPDDPNQGLLDPAVRKDLFKLDGTAPNSNMCFGDSGGAMLVNKDGKTYLGGVFFWTGFFCEDYSMFTRMDPFLSFFDETEKKAEAREKIVPELECVNANDDGTYTAYFGYTNNNGVSVDIPYGHKNSLALDTTDERPTHFVPGTQDFMFGVDFKKNQTVTWSLDPSCSPRTTVMVNKNSKACGAADVDNIDCSNACAAQLDSGCNDIPSHTQCMNSCLDFKFIIDYYYPACVGAVDAFYSCTAEQPSGTENWFCYQDGLTPPDANECFDELDQLYACLGS